MNYKVLIAGAGAALAFCGIYYLTQEVECQADNKRISKILLLALLKELETELTPYLITLASFSQDLQKRLGPDNSDQLIEILHSHCPITNDLERVESTVCQKYKVSTTDLQSICLSDYAQDEEVQLLVQSLKSIKASAFNGVPPKISHTLPPSITPQQVLSLTKDLYDSTIFVTYKNTKSLIQSGEKFSVTSSRYQEFSSSLYQETEKVKEKVFKMYNFHTFSIPEKTILQQAIQSFKTNPEFLMELTALEQGFQSALILITNGTYPEESYIKLAEKFDDRVIWELETPRQIVEEEVFEYINNH